MATTPAGYAHVEVGLAVFWDQETPHDPYEEFEVFSCPVCGETSEVPGPCNKWCYDAWTNCDDDDYRYR